MAKIFISHNLPPQSGNDDSLIGSLLTPISAQVDTLQLSNLIASKKEVVAYLASKNRIFSEDETIEQPTPLGLAVIANYYEEKADQTTRIYIASCIEDFQTTITKISIGRNGEKAILIF